MTTANARRQKRFRSRQAAEARQIRTLLSDAYRTLHEHVTYNHTVPANRYGPEQDITVCPLCGGCDGHTPDCLIYRAERALEEASA
jgi:hypothetical protein